MKKFSAEFISFYQQFTDLSCNRCEFIQNFLNQHGIKNNIIPINGNKHIYINFDQAAYSPLFRIKTLIAHYDRAPDSPGANDNSSSVISLLNLAVFLQNFKGVHNVRIFLTDSEEFSYKPEEETTHAKMSISEMGSFGLASVLKRLGIKNDDVYVFDCTGRGDVPVLGKTVLPLGVANSFKTNFDNFEQRTKNLIQSVSPNFLTLPISYSDNAGFLACKIPALAITMLPSNEAEVYLRNLMQNKELESFVRRHYIKSKDDSEKSQDLQILAEYEFRNKLPATWKLFHTQHDNLESLTPESFVLMAKILQAISRSKTMS